jgi:hypothetical protein
LQSRLAYAYEKSLFVYTRFRQKSAQCKNLVPASTIYSISPESYLGYRKLPNQNSQDLSLRFLIFGWINFRIQYQAYTNFRYLDTELFHTDHKVSCI